MKNLANKVVKKLIKKKLKVSFAESCTGGLLSSSITSISGSSKVFNLGLITYSNKAKVNILKVPNRIIEKYGAVSEECCLSMVKNLSKISKANISISITGIAGPNGGTKLKILDEPLMEVIELDKSPPVQDSAKEILSFFLINF